jgi:hypothetical protein
MGPCAAERVCNLAGRRGGSGGLPPTTSERQRRGKEQRGPSRWLQQTPSESARFRRRRAPPPYSLRSHPLQPPRLPVSAAAGTGAPLPPSRLASISAAARPSPPPCSPRRLLLPAMPGVCCAASTSCCREHILCARRQHQHTNIDTAHPSLARPLGRIPPLHLLPLLVRASAPSLARSSASLTGTPATSPE